MRYLLAPLGAALALAPHVLAQDPGDAYSALSARSIGPAGMSGRVTAIGGVESEPNRYYVGTATGGLWWTDDDGLTFDALWDDQPVPSIGAIAVYQASPEIVWVGSGEANPRNSSSVGNGVYRSQDGGKSWTHLGLEHTEKISRILVHPSDPDTCWVAALGTTWGENAERGVFKTTDGGKSWTKVLYVDERTGAADLVLDPANPNKLIAAMWDHRRWPHFFRSGGPGSGLYVTMDGGENWVRRTSEEGLPSGELGRMGLGICRTQPNVVYALVEAENNVLLRSDDGGASFRTVNSNNSVANRPFYYADIRVDPNDPDRVYNLASTVTYSIDGGKSFSTLVGWTVHPDHHAMWIDPSDPEHIVEGNDGGLAISRNHGETWRFARNLPLAQYYHINVDMDVPFNVYGGMQDNGSWRGPGSVWENGGIRNHHWDEVGFGDGFATIPLPGSTSEGYAMSQGGSLMRWNNVTGERKGIRPDAPEDVDLRFNWNAGIAVDPFDPNGVFYGSQFLHYSGDRGDSWSIKSADLTSNNPEWQRQDQSGGLTPDVTAAENYCSILTIAPSTLAEGLVWVGTDDGRLHVTNDGGASWESLEAKLFGVPRNTWIPHVEASKHDKDVAYVVCDDHRRANWEAYIYRTEDGGETFTRMNSKGIRGYPHVIEEDPVDPRLLFVGTEFGMWVSRDGGDSWFQWTHGLPTTPVTAIHVHPRDHDLVIGTFGRSAFVIDDIRPLRNPAAGDADQLVRLIEPPPAYQYRTKQTGASRFPANGEYRGQNRARGAFLSFHVAEFDERPAEASVTIESADGTPLKRIKHKVATGINRVTWRFDRAGFRGANDTTPDLELGGGPEILPGTYIVRINLGEHESSGQVEVLADPRVDIPMDERSAKLNAILEAGEISATFSIAQARLRRAMSDLDQIEALAKRDKDPTVDQDAEGYVHPQQPLLDAVKSASEKLDEISEAFNGPKDQKGISRRPNLISGRVNSARWAMTSSWDAPTPGQLKALEDANQALAEGLEMLNAALENEVAAAREAYEASGIGLLRGLDPVK